jgi:hypothetical protein
VIARRASLLAIVLAIVIGLGGPRAASAEPSASEQIARKALIVLRVLAYDRALATRAPGTEVTVLIVNAPTAAGRADRDRWLSGFALIPNVKAGGRRVRAQVVELDTVTTLDAAIAKLRPALIIVGAGLGNDIAAVQRVTRQRRVLSFSMSERDVRAGLAVGLTATDDGDEIVINLEGARAEGAKFSAGLLELARLVDETRP